MKTAREWATRNDGRVMHSIEALVHFVQRDALEAAARSLESYTGDEDVERSARFLADRIREMKP